MAVEKLPEVNPPSDRVPGRGLRTLPILEVLRWRNDGEIRDSRKSLRVSSQDPEYRPKEGTGGGGTHPGDLVLQPRAWPRQQATWEAPGPLWPSFGHPKASVSLIFLNIFLYFFGLRKIG